VKARAWGTALFLILAVWLVVDILQHLPKAAPPPDRGPEGFPQQVEGIGKVEFAFQGEIQLVAQTHELVEGGVAMEAQAMTRRTPWLSVRGWNPLPKEDDMLLSRLAVRSLESASKKSMRYQLDGPSGLLPLRPNSSTPELDTSRPWLLEKPVVQLPDFLDGTGLVLTLEEAELHPESGDMQSEGPFLIEGEGLRISGVGLQLVAESSLLKLGSKGQRVSWNMQTVSGDAIKATSALGRFFPQGGHQKLVLEKEVVMNFPPEVLNRKNGVTVLECSSLDLNLAADGDTWSPLGGIATGPSTWRAPDGVASGGDTELFWEDGVFTGLSLEGPTRIEPNEPADSWATSQHNATLSQDHSFTLNKDVHGGDLMHTFRADRMTFRGSSRFAEGSVHIQGPDGEMFSNTAESKEGVGWIFDGDVHGDRLFEGQRWQLFTAHAVHGKQGLSDAGPMFTLIHGQEKLSGAWLNTRHVGGELAVTATGNLVLERDGLVAHGDRLDQKNLKTILSGKPAWATFPIRTNTGTARSTRMVRDDEILFLHGNPRIDMPAEALGLEGGRVFIDAARANRNPKTGTWEMTGGVLFSGAITGNAARLTWTPGGEMLLESDFNNLARLQGTRIGQGDFDIRAEVIRLDESGSGELLRNCRAIFRAPDGTYGEVTGDRIIFHEKGGRAEDKVHVKWVTWAGQGERADWGFTEKGWQLELVEKAHLSGSEGEAHGHRIFYQHAQQLIRAEGVAGEQAELALVDGRHAVGDWLEYSFLNRLFSSGRAKFKSEVP